MSWNVTRTNIGSGELEHVLRADYSDFRSRYTDADGAKQAMDEQFEAALDMAHKIIRRGVVGTGRVNVTLSGHANPDHKNREGWGPEVVSIIVSAVAS